MNTKISYLYRDFENYKTHNSVIVAGEITAAEIAPFCLDGNIFYPEEIGLPSLSDHRLQGHEFVSFESTTDAPSCAVSAMEIKDYFQTHNLSI